MREVLMNYHVDPTRAGEVAAAAGVDRLVLTHFPPYPDRRGVVIEAGRVFDGTAVAGEDGLTVEV